MPRIGADSDLETLTTPSGFNFSAQRINTLGATEFTLASVCIDKSGSVSGWESRLETCVGEIVKACRLSPRADNMMVRITAFNDNIQEINQGFVVLNSVNPGDLVGTIHPGGGTALYDASIEAVESMMTYGSAMVKQDFSANGIVIVITDGENNGSVQTVNGVKTAIDQAVRGEILESMMSILVGVNVRGNKTISTALQRFKDDVGFTQYIEIENADERSLARLAQFVSKSISATSQALGSGGPSKSLVF